MNTVAGLVVIYIAKWFAGLGDIAANVIGYGAGLCLSFILNKNWTFAYDGPAGLAAARFVATFIIGYLLNLGTVLYAIENLQLNSYLAQAIGIVPYTVFTYLASRYYAFR